VKAEERKRALEDWYKNIQHGTGGATRIRMRSTSRDGAGGIAQGSGKYRRKKGAAYSKFEEEF
jgi:hypothetical protein